MSWRDSKPYYRSELFKDVCLDNMFKDGKSFVDAYPKPPLTWMTVVEAYSSEKRSGDFNLRKFVACNFVIPEPIVIDNKLVYSSVEEYIDKLWTILEKKGTEKSDHCTNLIALPFDYIVPGGRFTEIYYWDSYFTALGLVESGKIDCARNMVENFFHLIDEVGFIPNGNRSYFSSRSQPPFLSLFVSLMNRYDNSVDFTTRSVEMLEKEYRFWMDGVDSLKAGESFRRVVKLEDGTVLNRYYDDEPFERPESFREDYLLASKLQSEEQKKQLFLNLRAAAESGWDFSSRWMKDPADFSSIRTTEIAPVDLNCLMYNLERMLALWNNTLGRMEEWKEFNHLADLRKQAIEKIFFNEKLKCYADYIITEKCCSDVVSCAAWFPLHFNTASNDRYESTKAVLWDELLMDGGLASTNTKNSGQQWDFPNGWAPLQHIAAKALSGRGFDREAEELRRRWINCVKVNFDAQKYLMEKYDVHSLHKPAGGGEYSVQFGFGWTNGVTLEFINESERQE